MLEIRWENGSDKVKEEATGICRSEKLIVKYMVGCAGAWVNLKYLRILWPL